MSKTGMSLDYLDKMIDKLPIESVEHTGARQALDQLLDRISAPTLMRLPCEACGELHIDEGEFLTKPHHTHVCQHCGLTWRPAIGCTVGVRFLPDFKNEAAPEHPHDPVLRSTGTDGLGFQGQPIQRPMGPQGQLDFTPAEHSALAESMRAAPPLSEVWRPEPGMWARWMGGENQVLLLGPFSKLTGTFNAVGLDGKPYYPKPRELTRWIPRIDDRVLCPILHRYGTVTSSGLDTDPWQPYFLVKLEPEGTPGPSLRMAKFELTDLEPALLTRKRDP